MELLIENGSHVVAPPAGRAVCASIGTALYSAQPGRRVALTGTVVAVNQQSDSVTLIDLQRMEAYRHVKVVAGPHEAAASPDGRSVVVTNTTRLLALSADRTRLYCSNMRDGSVSAFDFQTGKKITDVRTGRECEGVGVTPDGRWVWAGNRAEDTISITDTRTLEVTKRIQSPGFPYRVQFTPDGKLALIPHAQASALVVGDVATQSIVKSITLGLTKVSDPSTAGVFPHPDNRHAFVTVRNDDSMLVLDIVSGETLARVPVQNSPDGVTYSSAQR
jgi:DNA-binding beta-propeller fold protein YncE